MPLDLGVMSILLFIYEYEYLCISLEAERGEPLSFPYWSGIHLKPPFNSSVSFILIPPEWWSLVSFNVLSWLISLHSLSGIPCPHPNPHYHSRELPPCYWISFSTENSIVVPLQWQHHATFLSCTRVPLSSHPHPHQHLFLFFCVF